MPSAIASYECICDWYCKLRHAMTFTFSITGTRWMSSIILFLTCGQPILLRLPSRRFVQMPRRSACVLLCSASDFQLTLTWRAFPVSMLNGCSAITRMSWLALLSLSAQTR